MPLSLPGTIPFFSRIRNYRAVDDRLGTSGQPSVGPLREDDPRYSLLVETGVVGSLGMRYAHIPVQLSAPTYADLLEVFEVMARHEGEKPRVRCAANMWVPAFLGLYLIQTLGR